MTKLEEGQQKLSNQVKIKCQINPNISSKTFQKPQKQCFYRYINSHDLGIQVCTQQQSKQKQCSIRLINNNIQNNQSSQFTQFTQEFYSNQFIKNFYNQNLVQIQQQNQHGTAKKMLYKAIKQVETTTQSSSYKTEMTSRNNQFTNQQLLNTMTDYLYSIKPQFLNLFSIYSDEAIMLRVKKDCQNSLDTIVYQIFQKFYTAAIEKLKNKFFKKNNRNNNEEQNKLKAQKQSEYHNFKNSLMKIIIQLVCPQILDCFDLSQYEKEQLIEIILRDLYLKVFKLDIQELHNVNFTDIIKINRLKSIFGQIINECLNIAENQISGNSKNKINISQNDQLKSRYFYIGKVKKGIQKLLRGKKVIRF
ncbi:hypothetical protein TTHERM_00158080 (macronuclear) [Tetrahymena thermophila SB210]|uniref:Uncharacterized protein n=1 Tax=Tetrahymena thermophila (strain SB210) TaxID=312017 RepID=Q22WC6_TETTS|nr:hypothetical protein TTHERM_00158080 [Tetrahymena thermophila SB210]EAR89491.1 hypothetical protein TTHERM_00158080 [Tetrahymena thermophila SB210]|eukprot:XP_001009736.1 hypothetical protein TTHERM_00158080 [Tetrahymena thermophila SB210]